MRWCSCNFVVNVQALDEIWHQIVSWICSTLHFSFKWIVVPKQWLECFLIHARRLSCLSWILENVRDHFKCKLQVYEAILDFWVLQKITGGFWKAWLFLIFWWMFKIQALHASLSSVAYTDKLHCLLSVCVIVNNACDCVDTGLIFKRNCESLMFDVEQCVWRAL